MEKLTTENNNEILAFLKAYDFLLTQNLTNKPILKIDSEKMTITLNEKE